MARAFWSMAALGVCGFAIAALPQQPNEPAAGGGPSEQTNEPATPRTAREGRFGHMAARGNVDHHMVHCLMNGNRGEIALSQFAQQRSTNEDVKKFASQMIEDHNKFLTKLQSVAGKRHEANEGTGVEQAAGTTNATDTAENAKTGKHHMGHWGGASAAQFLKILDEVAQQCQQSKQQELSQKTGTHFDVCYMGMQIGAHMMMADELTVYGKHASAELRPILQEGLETTKQHLTRAKELEQRLAEGLTKSTASR